MKEVNQMGSKAKESAAITPTDEVVVGPTDEVEAATTEEGGEE